MVRIITDSTSDLDPAVQEQWGVDVLPLTVNFGEEHFQDGVDITAEDFYRKLEQSTESPTTSQLGPHTFVSVFEQYLAAGDEIVCLHLSSDLSGTYQSAVMARDMVGSDRVYVVDSRTVTFGLGLLVQRAVALRDAGRSAAEIAEQLQALRGRMRFIAVVDTLEYLKRGGRISAAAAVLGGLLGINPIVEILDGKVELVHKARGKKAAFAWMREQLEMQPPDPSLPVALGHSHAPEALDACRSLLGAYAGLDDAVVGNIGSIVGTHAGPGAVGFAYFTR